MWIQEKSFSDSIQITVVSPQACIQAATCICATGVSSRAAGPCRFEQSWHQRQQAVIESGWSFQRQPLAHVTSIYIISCQQYSLDASSLHNSAYIFRQPVWQKQELTSHPFTHQRSRVVESITFSGLRSCSGARGVWRLLSHRKGRMIINSRLNRPIRLNLTAWT